MSNKVKDVDIKNRRYHSFNDITNIKSFDAKNIKCEVMQTIKDLKYVKINRVNPLYLIFRKVNGYFERINKNEYLMLVPN